MKRTKNYLLYAFLFVMMCIWFGCSTKEEFIPELDVTVTSATGVESKQLTFDENGGSFTISIKSNSHWNIGGQADWISLSHKDGVGDQQISATVASATESRSAVITIYLKEYKQESVSIDVLQHVIEKPTPDDGDQGGDNNEGDEGDDNPNQPDDGNNEEQDPNEPSNPDQGDDDGEGGENENGDDKGDEGETGGDEGDDNEGDTEGGEGIGGEDGNGDDNTGDNSGEEQPEEPTNKEPQPITIESLIALMTEDMKSVVIDNERDRVLTAIVMNDTNGNNFYPNHLILCNEGATTVGNGITLSGKLARPADLGLNMGDKVEVTLKAKNAVAIKYKGRYEVTGEAGSEWMSLKVLSSNNKITPIEVKPETMASYQAMAVTLKDVTPTTAGYWHSAENKGYTEFTSSDGTKFSVFVGTEALFSANEFHITSGNLTGIVVVEDNVAILYPRNLNDVYDFNGAATEDNDKEDSEGEEKDNMGEDNEESGDENNGEDNENGGEDGSENGSYENNGEDNEAGNEGSGEEGDGKDNEENNGNEDDNGNTEDGNQGVGNEGNGESGENGEDIENGEDNTTESDEPYTLVSDLSNLREGEYYIGGYRESALYLATGTLTEQNHCTTKKFSFSNGEITPLEDDAPAKVKLIRSEVADGYYIMFANGQYLIATDNAAGSLSLSSDKSNYWIFSEHGDGGFIMKQSGVLNVKLIVSKRAKSDILRSVDGDESGGAVILIRIN